MPIFFFKPCLVCLQTANWPVWQKIINCQIKSNQTPSIRIANMALKESYLYKCCRSEPNSANSANVLGSFGSETKILGCLSVCLYVCVSVCVSDCVCVTVPLSSWSLRFKLPLSTVVFLLAIRSYSLVRNEKAKSYIITFWHTKCTVKWIVLFVQWWEQIT